MFEVNFNNNVNIEKCIKDNKKSKKSMKKPIENIVIGLLWAALGFVASSLLFVGSNTIIQVFKIISYLISGMGLGVSGVAFKDLVSNIISNSNKKKASNELTDVVEVLGEKNINTNVDDLTKSVVFENIVSNSNQRSEDGEVSFNKEVTNDKYYLFLNENSDICGLLERNTEKTIDDQTSYDKKFYVLENDDINKVKNKVAKTRKLIKK